MFGCFEPSVYLLFLTNILSGHFEGKVVVDLGSGTGEETHSCGI
jgi:predicted RNA methylase